MSNINKITANEQLFTELTPEEGAVVAGGAYLYIEKIHAINAGADTTSKDDTYITVDGNKIWGEKYFTDGDSHDVKFTKHFNGELSINLYDSDSNLFEGDDDFMGGFTVSSASTNGMSIETVSGGGSTYQVHYKVY